MACEESFELEHEFLSFSQVIFLFLLCGSETVFGKRTRIHNSVVHSLFFTIYVTVAVILAQIERIC